MTRITFLGTAGGRFATIMQTRRTGGIVIQDGAQLHIDPGPGAIRAAWRYGIDPRATDAVLISHAHTEHYGDAEIIIEAMTHGGKRSRGVLLASRSVLRGETGMGPAVSPYHQGLPERTVALSPADTFDLGGLSLEATPTDHSDASGIGIRAMTSGGIVALSSDTTLAPDVIEALAGARVLVLNVTIETEITHVKHLTPATARILAEKVAPEIAVLTHFGQWLIEAGPEHIAARMEEDTGLWVVAASDGLTIDLARTISISSVRHTGVDGDARGVTQSGVPGARNRHNGQ
ncbi:MAG: MBL fold metallo-hydrolase [Thermoplasmata archaeon]|nr:MBL fold metallo-hydrolase [Thermoplasmata archaeon]